MNEDRDEAARKLWYAVTSDKRPIFAAGSGACASFCGCDEDPIVIIAAALRAEREKAIREAAAWHTQEARVADERAEKWERSHDFGAASAARGMAMAHEQSNGYLLALLARPEKEPV